MYFIKTWQRATVYKNLSKSPLHLLSLRNSPHIQKTSLKQTKFLIYYYCQILNINLVIIAKQEKGQDNNEAIYLDLNRFNMFNNLLWTTTDSKTLSTSRGIPAVDISLTTRTVDVLEAGLAQSWVKFLVSLLCYGRVNIKYLNSKICF